MNEFLLKDTEVDLDTRTQKFPILGRITQQHKAVTSL